MSIKTAFLDSALDIDRIRAGLSTRTVGRRLCLYETVRSTNAALGKLAAAGAVEGTVVLAESQTGGTLSARTTTDRVLAIVPPISAFVAAGFEHSIANMYFIPLGLLIASLDPAFAAAAGVPGLSIEALSWRAFLARNSCPSPSATSSAAPFWWDWLQVRLPAVARRPPGSTSAIDDMSAGKLSTRFGRVANRTPGGNDRVWDFA